MIQFFAERPGLKEELHRYQQAHPED